MANEGDIIAGQVLRFKFSTNNTSAVPTTLAGTPALSVYKNNSTTESTSGVTLTVDFDARTGCNHVDIDTSSDGTFYAAGNDYSVVITAGTVGGTSVVGQVVGEFSIENRTQKSDVRKWNGTTVASPATAGVPDVNAKNVNNVSAASVTTIGANLGTTQPVNFTGTGASALAKSDMVDIAGAAVSTSTAQIGVNVVNFGGTAGTFASGRPEVNATHFAGTISAGEAGYVAIGAASLQTISGIAGNAQKTYYVRKNGNDGNTGTTPAAAFLTVAAAVTAANANAPAIVRVGPGTFAEGNVVFTLADDVSLIGSGMYSTVITSTAVLTTSGCIVAPGNRSVVKSMTIVTAGSSVFQAHFGFRGVPLGSQPITSNWLVEDVYFSSGDTDNCYFASNSTTPASVRGVIRWCKGRAKYDTFNCINASDTGWDLIVDLVQCDFRANGPSVAGSSAGLSRAVNAWAGTVRIFGGYFQAGGSSTNNYAIAVQDGQFPGDGEPAQIELYDNPILSSSGTGHADISVGASATAAVIVERASFNPASVSNSGGTITYITSQHATDFATGAIDSNAFAQAAADKAWSTTTRALTDKSNFALTAGEHTNIASDTQTGLTAQGFTVARGPKLDNLDATVSSRLASAGYTAPPSAATIAASVLTDTADLTTAGSIGKLIHDNLDAQVSTRLPTSSYTAPPSAATIATTIWQDATASDFTTASSIGKRIMDNVDATVSSRLASSSYTAPPTAAAIATALLTDTNAGDLATAGSLGKVVTQWGAMVNGSNQFTAPALANAPAGGGGGTNTIDVKSTEVRA